MSQAATQLESELNQLAGRYGLSVDAVRTLLRAVSAGGGQMAQFRHPELGGSGQWMRGGMTMIGQMGNYALQNTVSSLCAELAALVEREPALTRDAGTGQDIAGDHAWWPAGLGHPSARGGQNDVQYAYFPDARRLAISRQGRVTLYDTSEHRIGGVQQQQGGASSSLEFTSQQGTFSVDSLVIVNG